MKTKLKKDLSHRKILTPVLFTILSVTFFTCFLFSAIGSAQQKWVLYDDLLSISFPNEKDGWACGRWGTILHSPDGGLTWHRQESGTDFTLSSIYFVDSKTGWAVGNEGTIIHTKDGGKTWAKQESPAPYYHMDVYFVTPLKGWIASEDTHILHTKDGGKTWRIQFNDEEYILKAVSFSDELHGWAVGEYGYIYYTENGGRRWEKQAGHFDINEETGALEGGRSLYDVVAIDPQRAWAVGMDGEVIKTADRGKTWEKLDTGVPQTQLFFISYDGGDTIVIGGKGVCVFSDDRGRSWKNARFDPHIEYSWIYAAVSLGPCRFVVGGENGAIYRSTGSNFWQRVRY